MFGDVSFAQAPFAALGGNSYPVDVSESASGTASSGFDVRFGGLMFEGATSSDASMGVANIHAFLSDIATGVADAYANGSTLRGTVTEGVNATAVATVSSAQLSALVYELAQAVDTPSAVAIKPAGVVEGATGTDASDRGAGLFSTQSEGATGTDTSSKTAIYVSTIAETATGTDNPSSSAIIVVNPSGVQVHIAIGDPLSWGVIDDTQNPNWVPIQT